MGSDEHGPLWLTFDLDDEPRTVVAARAGLTDEEVKEARRLLRAGKAATDPRVARLVVALAEKERDGDAGMLIGWLVAFFLAVASGARLAVHPVNATTLSLVAVAAVVIPATIVRTRIRLRYPEAERENRLVLESYRLAPSTEPPVLYGPSRALREAAFALPGGLAAGILESIVDHGTVTGAAVVNGLVLGIVLVVVVLIRGWLRAHPDA